MNLTTSAVSLDSDEESFELIEDDKKKILQSDRQLRIRACAVLSTLRIFEKLWYEEESTEISQLLFCIIVNHFGTKKHFFTFPIFQNHRNTFRRHT